MPIVELMFRKKLPFLIITRYIKLPLLSPNTFNTQGINAFNLRSLSI